MFHSHRCNASLPLTFTVYTHVLEVGAMLVSAPSGKVALFQVTLIALALHLVQPNWFSGRRRTELTPWGHPTTVAESKLTAHNISFVCAKQVVTHSAPSAVVQHLQTSRVCRPTAVHKSNWVLILDII